MDTRDELRDMGDDKMDTRDELRDMGNDMRICDMKSFTNKSPDC